MDEPFAPREVLRARPVAVEADHVHARRAAGRKAHRQEDPWGDKQLREMQLALQEELGRRVTINRRGVGGILTVEYNSMDDLSDLVDRLTGGN